MEVHRFIYTKVPPEESPWRKADFHTIFYPVGLLKEEHVFDIERRIHFPSSEGLTEKETVFFQRIGEEDYLVILHIRSLPEARDVFGRGGIFLCQGFLFPEEMWRWAVNPARLFDLVREHLFSTREELLSSPAVDKKTGNIQPIVLPEGKREYFSGELPQRLSEFDWRMVLLLNRLASSSGRTPPLVIEAPPQEVSRWMNLLIAYVPADLKPYLSWDTAADGCNLTFYPVKIVGFHTTKPAGGNPIYVRLDSQTIPETPEIAHLLEPNTPYERWLWYCRSEAVSKDEIEGAYQISLFLERGVDCPTKMVLTNRSCFASVNREVIESLFSQQCTAMIGDVLTRYVVPLLDTETMLELLLAKLPAEKIVEYVEEVILRNRLSREAVKMSLPAALTVASRRAQLIERLWRGEPLKGEDLAPLSRKRRQELIEYIVLTTKGDSTWLVDVLRADEEIFNLLLSSSETREVVEKLLLRVILQQGDFEGIASLLLNSVLSQHQGFSLINNRVDLMGVLEDFLRQGRWDENQMRQLVGWARRRRPPAPKYAYVRAFLYPQLGIATEVLADGRVRQSLIRALIRFHRYSDERLESLGFQREEISAVKASLGEGGWVTKIKRLFRVE